MGVYILIFLGILIIPLSASIFCNKTYNKYKRIKIDEDINGFDIARKILNKNGLTDVHIVETSGVMSDHYDPKRKVVRLSHDVFHNNTVSSIAIASHEVGHALQDKNGYIFMNIRAKIFPIVNFASTISYVVLFLGFIFSMTDLIWLGILCVALGVIFQLITLPVEFDASRRAEKEIMESGIFSEREINGTKNMLLGAALTYVAGLVASLLELLRLILIASNND